MSALASLSDIPADTLAQFALQIKNKSVTISPELVRAGIDLEIQKIDFKIKEIEKVFDQLSNQNRLVASHQDVLQKLINDLKVVKADLQQFIVPVQGFKKSFENIGEWLVLKIKKIKLQARIYKEIAQQTGIKSAAVIARLKEAQANQIERALQSLKSGKIINQETLLDPLKAKAKKIYEDLQKQAEGKVNREIDEYKKQAGKKIEDAIDLVSKKIKELYDRYKNQLQPNE
ncbi:MAG: hypothetical protein ACOYT8_06455 [Candidatus Dependentiae bacterium]